MKHRIYPRIVKGDANEVTKDEILWIDKEDGTVDLQKRNNNGKLVSIVATAAPTEIATFSLDEPEDIDTKESSKSTTTNILD